MLEHQCATLQVYEDVAVNKIKENNVSINALPLCSLGTIGSKRTAVFGGERV